MPKQAPREFKVEPPISYQSLPLTPLHSESEIKEFTLSLRRLAAPQEQPTAGAKRAVWIVHGMGQQVPFETLENITNGLIGAANREKLKWDGPKFRNVRVDQQVLQRVELVIHPHQGDPVEVDLYECYWAPKTEGEVKLADVVGFLWNGGIRGFINFFQKFQRALFGRMTYFRLKWRTPAYLLITLAVLAALNVINAIIVGVSATIAGIGTAQALIPSDRVPALTCLAGMVCALAITFGVTLFLAEMSRPARGEWQSEAQRKLLGNSVCVVSWIAFAITVFAIIAGAGLMALVVWPRYFLHDLPYWLANAEFRQRAQGATNLFVLTAIVLAIVGMIQRRRGVSSGQDRDEDWTTAALFYLAFGLHLLCPLILLWLGFHGGQFPMPAFAAGLARWPSGAKLAVFFSSYLWVWPFLFLLSSAVRKFLVQYVGDVTAYVTSNKIDRFDELRRKIKDLARDSASAVYSAQAAAGNQFEYGKVAVVGHSLGSVIAYDTLNRLLVDDDLAAGPPPVPRANVASRTSIFLTFGSPLDKTAFFFSIMGKNTRHVREQLAAVVQPLIQDYKKYRTFPWVNVYSRNDIISGALEFYDLPGTAIPPGVKNVKDEDAFVPLVAHVDYWGNRTVWDQLLQAVIR